MNRAKFFAGVKPMFGGSFKQPQVEGLDAILDEWDSHPGDARHLAYMLATTFHETGKTMQPVRETFADTDEQAIAILDSSFKRGRLSWVKTPYWRKDADGKSWLGRGLVQLTHRSNYEKFGITDHPEKAMEMTTAVKIMFVGMREGIFTGKKLSDYFSGTKSDWVNARRIINGLDRANDIAGYGRQFYAAIEAAR